MFSALATFLFLLSPAAQGPPSLLGNWMTPNKSIVHVYSCNDTLICMRLVDIGPKNKPQVDVNNPIRADRDRPLCGLEIGSGFVPRDGAHAQDGHIYDPESGKTYSAQADVDGTDLKLRGYVGIALFGRTETWRRTQRTPTCG